MKNPKRDLLISYVIFGAVLALAALFTVAAARDAAGELGTLQQAEAVETVDVSPSDPERQQTAEKQPSKPSQAVEPVVAPTASDNTTAPAQPSPAESPRTSEPAPAKKQQMERIPFTNKDVTPGDPASYEGTYGQCPFYENAMHGKGCVPPPDIECNADWSVCTYKGE